MLCTQAVPDSTKHSRRCLFQACCFLSALEFHLQVIVSVNSRLFVSCSSPSQRTNCLTVCHARSALRLRKTNTFDYRSTGIDTFVKVYFKYVAFSKAGFLSKAFCLVPDTFCVTLRHALICSQIKLYFFLAVRSSNILFSLFYTAWSRLFVANATLWQRCGSHTPLLSTYLVLPLEFLAQVQYMHRFRKLHPVALSFSNRRR